MVTDIGNDVSIEKSVHNEEENPFCQYYGMLLHQQNMLQDHVRTGTYERAMRENSVDFKDKVVLDVGAGTGILAYFAVKAGARKVYAVELSQMADCARTIMEDNGLSDKIIVIKGKLEDITPPEKVDVIVSEPMGFFLVHERMLETYLTARKLWLKPGGLMFPAIGNMFVCPFTDDSIYAEQMAKASFWQQTEFYGLNLRSMASRAVENHFSQPVVGYFSPNILISAQPVTHTIDFNKMNPEELHEFEIPLKFVISTTAIMHGFGCWFNVEFNGSSSQVILSTGPHCRGTHWYQCRFLLQTPIAVNARQSISGKLLFVANKKYSYDVEVIVSLDGTTIKSHNKIRLHDQMYHYLSNPNPSNSGQYQY